MDDTPALFAVGMVQTNFFGWAFGSWIMKGFYVYNHNLCSKQSQLGTDLLWFFQKTENILVKSSEIPKYGPKSKLNFFEKKIFFCSKSVHNVFRNFKIQCVKNLKIFFSKFFTNLFFKIDHMLKLGVKSNKKVIKKKHSRWVRSWDCFQHR